MNDLGKMLPMDGESINMLDQSIMLDDESGELPKCSLSARKTRSEGGNSSANGSIAAHTNGDDDVCESMTSINISRDFSNVSDIEVVVDTSTATAIMSSATTSNSSRSNINDNNDATTTVPETASTVTRASSMIQPSAMKAALEILNDDDDTSAHNTFNDDCEDDSYHYSHRSFAPQIRQVSPEARGRTVDNQTSRSSIMSPPDEVFESLFEDVALPVSDDLDHLLGDRSPEECHWLLRGMVVDLLTEVDTLKKDLEKKNTRIKDMHEEESVMKKDYRDQLFNLMLAVGKATGDGKEERKADYIKATFEELDTNKATELVIQKLTKKIELLNIDNSRLISVIQEMQGKIEDLESVNETRNLKIETLEAQFLGKHKADQRRFGRVLGMNRLNKNVGETPPRATLVPSPKNSASQQQGRVSLT